MRFDAAGVHVHQSDVKSWLNCGEQVRLKNAIDSGSFETDAATVGTCLHALIEEEIVDGFFGNEKDAQAWAALYFLKLLEAYQAAGATYSRSSFDTDLKALKVLDKLVVSWFHSSERTHLWQLGEEGEILPEWDFDVPLGVQFLHPTDGPMDVYIAGQADLLLPGEGLWDWKTASQQYRRWEKQRYDVQSTAYTYAAHYEGLLLPDQWGEFSFTFKVFDTKLATPGPPESIVVKRSPKNWGWLKTQVINMLTVQAALPDGPWPLNDNHVLCSPKWCPVWDHCKGAHVSGETWA